MLLRDEAPIRDAAVSADVTYDSKQPFAAAGLVVRYDPQARTGYAACMREIERGVDPQTGPWERPLLQLYRLDPDGPKLLQEAKVMHSRSGRAARVKVVCRGPELWVFHGDMDVPVLREYDDVYDRPGRVGVWKDPIGRSSFSGFTAKPPAGSDAALEPPSRTDWSWVRGAVYVRSDAVNSVQMWTDYWDHTEVLDREFAYAKLYGFNMVQTYLHWVVWDGIGGDEYLRRIDDFLSRAAAHGLKVNLILWDDQGHVEPSLTFAEPVPGRHNSQMMPSPSHAIRGSTAELDARRERFEQYVVGVAGRFKDDARLSFWQLYNEPMGDPHAYRDGTADANLNRLLAWTRQWVKSTGTRTPVTATGGGFYGPKYSDFYTYHSYAPPGGGDLPGAAGGPEHLCTETLNRPAADLFDVLEDLAGRDNGFVVWELMVGRDNCRFPWGHPDGPDEPVEPFHGVVYPDGHPWRVSEIQALLGHAAFGELEKRTFRADYFSGEFFERKKTSIVPWVDFDLGDAPGTGSPDASAGIGRDDWSVRYTASVTPATSGTYAFSIDSDGGVDLWVDGKRLIKKRGDTPMSTTLRLEAGRSYDVRIECVHACGVARARVEWSGPGFERRLLTPGRVQP